MCYADAEQRVWACGYPVSLVGKSPECRTHGQHSVGVALAQPPLIQVLTNTKAPYNISTPTSALALRALSDGALSIMKQKVAALVLSRIKLIASLETMQRLGVGKVIGGNHANFVLVPIIQRDDVAGVPDNKRAAEVYRILAEERGVVVRFRGNEIGCKGCLRITVGTEEENETLIQRLQGVLALV